MKLKRSPFVALVILALIVIICASVYFYLITTFQIFKVNPYKLQSNTNQSAQTLTGSQYPSILDGTLTNQALSVRHPLAVVINAANGTEYGISSASIVYENSGPDLLAIYGPRDAAKIGPIDNSESSLLNLAAEYDAFFAHLGKNSSPDIKDVGSGNSQFSKAYWTISAQVFSSTYNLYPPADQTKWPTPVNDSYPIYTFLDNSQLDPVPKVSQITINFNNPNRVVSYNYDQTNHDYRRYQNNKTQTDSLNNQPLVANNIIIQSNQGRAELFQGGQEVTGSWQKTAADSRTRFYDSQGNLISLIPGQTWIEQVPDSNQVSLH